MFRNPIFEAVKNQEVFQELKNAIRLNEYRKFKFLNEDEFVEAKCIKLIFVDNNWYLAYADSKDILKLARVSFIEQVRYTTKNSYQKSSIEIHTQRLKTKLQNSKTLFDKEQKTATIKATPFIAKYFKEDMKRFFPSQKFKQELEDGSIIFSINYTQELEIMPFIQKWLPDLVVLEPQELKEHYVKKLQDALKNNGA